jgi:glutamate dehydrogenase
MAKYNINGKFNPDQLKKAIAEETLLFQNTYQWLAQHMHPGFFELVDHEKMMLITRHLMDFPLQEFRSLIHFKDSAIMLCLDSSSADMEILKSFKFLGIKNYQAFSSNAPPPFEANGENLKVAFIHFTEYNPEALKLDEALSKEEFDTLFQELKKEHENLTLLELKDYISKMNARFLSSLSKERLVLAINLFLKAKSRDYCQYEVRYNENAKADSPSMQIILAWKNTPKHQFLYRLSKIIYRHNLVMKRFSATYVNPYSDNSILLMSIGLHGKSGKVAWEDADIQDLLQEITTLKYFIEFPEIEEIFVDSYLVSGNMGNFIKNLVRFIHQLLLHIDPNLYSLDHIVEGLCRHPELTVQLCHLFEYRFHPTNHNQEFYQEEKQKLLDSINQLDTGQIINDTRRKNILSLSMEFIDKTLKTNFFRSNKSSISFRIDPLIIRSIPLDLKEKFPEVPYAIFYITGLSFIGFHIRFEDLARGGLRAVMPRRYEQMVADRDNVFLECYNLALTQHKKNKDIPEGGAKGIIFLDYFHSIDQSKRIYYSELRHAKVAKENIELLLSAYETEQKTVYLYQSQRAYIHALMTLINCHDNGELKAKDIVDYYRKPEYLYLGPDENMHNSMLEWIASYAVSTGYKVGAAFISSKPKAGINHKEYGVTSLGVNVYMEEVLRYLNIDPTKQPFTLKISGGPDGDVAGNQILNLYRYYPNTAKILAMIDVSGTIYDPIGLDLEILANLFKKGEALAHYPPERLSSGGFLLNTLKKRADTAYSQQTLCYRKEGNLLKEEWLSGNEMNHILRHTVHQTVVDIFIPAGGRPRTLNISNYTDYLDKEGKPTSKAVVEAANLYISPEGRSALEKRGLIIIKDSSANKGGVICSSLEVLTGLIMTEAEFLDKKPLLMEQILEFIKEKARLEALLLLKTHEETHASLIEISDEISRKINTFTYQILSYLKPLKLSSEKTDPFNQCILSYLLPLLREEFADRALERIPDIHKKAIISCYIASKLVYERGIEWEPSIVDILPIILRN